MRLGEVRDADAIYADRKMKLDFKVMYFEEMKNFEKVFKGVRECAM